MNDEKLRKPLVFSMIGKEEVKEIIRKNKLRDESHINSFLADKLELLYKGQSALLSKLEEIAPKVDAVDEYVKDSKALTLKEKTPKTSALTEAEESRIRISRLTKGKFEL